MLNDPLANMMSAILNHEKTGKKELIVKPVSKVIRKVLEIMNSHGYVGANSTVEDGRGDYLLLNLLGTINKCGVIKPRYAVQLPDYERFEKRYLPARDFGILIVSTNKGMMTHVEAKKQRLGGRLVAYCY